MNGKHTTKQNKKKRFRLKIVDKRKFFKMAFAMSALILSFVCLMLHGNEVNNENVIQTEQIEQQQEQNEMQENVENTNQDIDKNQEMLDNNSGLISEKAKITSRGGLTSRDLQPAVATIVTEKLENPEIKYISVESGLNVRESYSTESKIVKSLAYAEQVTITEKYQDWGKIGENQWVNTKYLSDTKPVIKKEVEKKIESKKQATPSMTTSSEYIAFNATGYCSCSKCCGKATGITASGVKAQAGVTVAMSSKYAFGTKIEIKGMGTRIVQDRGGAIHGNRIDIYFSSHQEALNFGRRTIYVKILK